MEIKELLKALDLPEDIDTPEKAVSAHASKFIPLADAHTDDRVVEKVEGKLWGTVGNAVKREFGLKNEDIKDKKFEDILKFGVDGLKTKITELTNTGADEKLTKLQTELDKIKIQADQYKTEMEKVVGEKTELETGFNNKLKGFKVASIYKDAKGKLLFADGIPEVSKLGFDTLISSKYEVSLDDKDNVIVLHKDGKRVANPTKSGAFLTLDEILDSELDQAGLKKKNNLKGNQQFQFQNQNNGGNNVADTTRKVNPKAVAMAERSAK